MFQDKTQNEMFEYSVRDLISRQINDKKYFKRIDIIVKYMALEDYFKGDGIGINLYKKMYKKLFRGRSDESINKRIDAFKEIALKAHCGQFDTRKYPIIITRKFDIWNGTHRIACAIYFNYKNVFVIQTPKTFKRGCDLGSNKFKDDFFTQEEWHIINEKQKEIFSGLNIR